MRSRCACKEKLELIICKCLKTRKKPLSAKKKTKNKLNPHIAFSRGFMWTQATLMGTKCCHHRATLAPKVKVKKGWFLKADTKEVTISKINCRQYCFGLLGLISAVLMVRWRLSYEATANDPTNVISSKPCQSALTSEHATVMTHPTRMLNFNMKAKLHMWKNYI